MLIDKEKTIITRPLVPNLSTNVFIAISLIVTMPRGDSPPKRTDRLSRVPKMPKLPLPFCQKGGVFSTFKAKKRGQYSIFKTKKGANALPFRPKFAENG